jgi:threonine/homoserine/homoserine lactone efflux protein
LNEHDHHVSHNFTPDRENFSMTQNPITPWSFLVQGVALGLAAAATPGAFQAYLITRSILNGFKKGGVIALAPIISDPPAVIIVLLFLNQLPTSFFKVISLAGGGFLFYLAYSTYHHWRSSPIVFGDAQQTTRGNIFRGAIINILSPGLYLYWTLVNGPLLISAIQQSWMHALAFLSGFYGFFIGGMLLIAALVSQTRKLGEKYIKYLLFVSTLTLTVFGIYLIFRSLFD